MTLLIIAVSTFGSFVATDLLVASPAEARIAEHIEGLIEVRQNQIMLRMPHSRQAYLVYCETREILADLEKLSTGDLLIGTGQIHVDKQIIALHSIDMVGLRRLLGTWRTSNSEVFEFRDFNRLHVYTIKPHENASPQSIPNAKDLFGNTPHPDAFFKHLRKLHYTLAPDSNSESRWSIFMADQSSVRIGSLTISPSSMKLTVYDPDTGRVANDFELARVSYPLKKHKQQ